MIFLAGCNKPTNSAQQLFTGDPANLMLQEEDMPGLYVLMEDESGIRPNENLTMDSDDPEAQEQYLQRTGRLKGWENRFILIEPTDILPGFIFNQVVVYETPEGAQVALNWPVAQVRETLETERKIGDAMTLTMMPFEAPDDSAWIDYRIEFTHNNILSIIVTYAPEVIATPDYALDLAEKLSIKIQDFTNE